MHNSLKLFMTVFIIIPSIQNKQGILSNTANEISNFRFIFPLKFH